MKWKISYNAPLVLSFSLAAVVVWLLNMITADAFRFLFVLSPNFSFFNPLDYLSLIGYIFGHADGTHLISNLSFILLLGPILEEKYGSRKLGIMIGATALITAMIHLLFFSHGLLGASGIVFMFIILISFSNVREGEIPLTFILILVLFIGKEVLQSFQADRISQFAHILGGICGSLFGLTKTFGWNKTEQDI